MKGCFSMEFYVTAAIQVGTMLVTLGVIYGMMKKELDHLKESIARLERKQDRYNNLQERILTLELTGTSSTHRT